MEGYKTEKISAEHSDEEAKEFDDQTSTDFIDGGKDPFGKKLFDYFEMLINEGVLKIDLTEESYFTLEQFFTDEFLCIEEITDNLEDTNFEAEYENVGKKVKVLWDKGLLVKKEKNFTGKYPRRRNTVNYRLTSLGIFYLFVKGEKNLSRNIFKYYENDILFEIFLYPIINKGSIGSLSSTKILHFFVDYVKHICSAIYKELKIVDEIKRIGWYEEPSLHSIKSIKWKSNLKDNKAKWLKFCTNLMENVFPTPLRNPEELNQPYLQIKRINISDKTTSFVYRGTKYCLEIVQTNSSNKRDLQARLYMNDKEVTIFNNNKPQTITVEKKSDCFQIGKVEYVNIRDYKKILGSKFSILLRNLRFQLGLDILRSFEERDETTEMIYENILKDDTIKVHFEDLKILAKDKKFKKELNEIKENLERNFREFSKYNQ